MFTENDIEKLIQPLLKRQEALNLYILTLIANRVKEIGTVLPSDVYKLERLLKSGADVRKINKMIAKIAGLQEKDIKRIIEEVARDAYFDAKPYYDYRSRTFIPFQENIALQTVIKAVQRQTLDTFRNLSRAQAFMIRDRKHVGKLKPTKISKVYTDVVDEAIQLTQSGILDYHTAMRRTMSQLAESGIRYVTYDTPTGRVYTQRMDTAVRRNILDGVRAINQGVQDEVGKQFGADGKEITVHANSAPDHEPIQGHQFSNEEFEKLQTGQPFVDYNGRQFNSIQRPIGVWNCRHFTYSIILGITKPNYTQEQLDKMIEENQKGYTDKNGNHLTKYECTQKQREMETKIRKLREKQTTLQDSGDTEGAKAVQAKVDNEIKKYRSFSNACGLKPKMEKTTIPNYQRI